MKTIFPGFGWALAVILTLTPVAFAAEDLALVQNEAQEPQDLSEAYHQLVQSFRSGDSKAIQEFILGDTVKITAEPRAKDKEEYGTDINLSFAQSGFSAEVLSVRQDAPDIYLLRTNSSYLRFVKTQQSGWKLFEYGDKPIE